MAELANKHNTSWQSASKFSGLLLIIAGLSYITLAVILALVSRGHLPATGQELLVYVTGHGSVVEFAMIVFIVKDTCILLAFPVLAMMLGGLSRPSLWIGTVSASLGMLLDILSGLIVIAYRRFADSSAAAHVADRDFLATLSEFIFRYVWRVETPFIVALLAVAVILFSRTMIGTRFGHWVPLVGIILGSMGVIGAASGFIQPVLLLSLWYVAVGFQLMRGS